MNRLRGEARADLVATERELVSLEAQRQKLVDAIYAGVSGAELKDDFNAIAARREELQQQIALRRDPKPLLHPDMGKLYREWVIEWRGDWAFT